MAHALLILSGHNMHPSCQDLSSHISPVSGEIPEGTGASLNLEREWKAPEQQQACSVLKKQYIPPYFPLISEFSPLLEESAPPLPMQYQVQGCQMTYTCPANSHIRDPVQRALITLCLAGLHLGHTFTQRYFVSSYSAQPQCASLCTARQNTEAVLGNGTCYCCGRASPY